MEETFEGMLTGGHHNSLGRTVEVAEQVLAQPNCLEALFSCYNSDDDVVRLRTSSAIKRVQAARPELLIPFYDRLIDEVGELDQASAQWTLAILFNVGKADLTPAQLTRARDLMRRNLVENRDWIVLNTTIETLSDWSASDPELRDWLLPQLKRLSDDPRKSVKGRATKYLKKLQAASECSPNRQPHPPRQRSP